MNSGDVAATAGVADLLVNSSVQSANKNESPFMASLRRAMGSTTRAGLSDPRRGVASACNPFTRRVNILLEAKRKVWIKRQVKGILADILFLISWHT